jgi:hypothetical protein
MPSIKARVAYFGQYQAFLHPGPVILPLSKAMPSAATPYRYPKLQRPPYRPVPEPPQKPAQLKTVQPERRLQARLEESLALRWVSRAQPCIVASNRSTRRISHALKSEIEQRKLQKRKMQIC